MEQNTGAEPLNLDAMLQQVDTMTVTAATNTG